MWRELQKHWNVKCSGSLSLEQIKNLGIETELESPPQLGGCFLCLFLPFYFNISSEFEHKSWILKLCSNRIMNIRIWVGKGKGAFLQYRAVEFLTRDITGLWHAVLTLNYKCDYTMKQNRVLLQLFFFFPAAPFFASPSVSSLCCSLRLLKGVFLQLSTASVLFLLRSKKHNDLFIPLLPKIYQSKRLPPVKICL